MRLRSSVDHMSVTEMLTQGFRFAMGEILKSSLSRFASQLAGMATKLPANIRRGPILDADEAEDRSVSFNLLDRGPAPQEPASASPVPHRRGPSIPGSALATRPELGMVSPEPRKHAQFRPTNSTSAQFDRGLPSASPWSQCRGASIRARIGNPPPVRCPRNAPRRRRNDRHSRREPC
jgi:hypothetical protein